MENFSRFISEQKNTHMTHIEDLVIYGGVNGTRQAINARRELRDMLGGSHKGSVSVKWDGAPAIFAGVDPRNGKFFVAKKGIFNKNPKVYKTDTDIDADTTGDLNTKLKLALAELPKLGIKGVIQGDFLYAREDIKEADINGESYITFHPNTIVYAIPKKSDLAKQILGSKIGVVWHTTYRGDSFETMSASFGQEIATDLKKVKTVWAVDAVFKDVSGSATLTVEETKHVTSLLSDAGKLFAKMKRPVLDGLSDNEERRIRVNAFINVKVREGQRVGDPKKFVADMIKYIEDFYQKDADKKKTESGKQSTYKKRDEILSYFKDHGSEVFDVFKIYNIVDEVKYILLDKLNRVNGMRTFLRTKDGYEVTGQEGFVAIDHLGKNALKLVDRLQFSKANFSPEYIKGWQR
jgi:hypothetical protein